jgi:hypothetical protein
MRHNRSFFGILLSGLVLLLACVPVARAQDGLPGALSRTDGVRRISAFAEEIAAADFDNDQKPDGAILLQAGQVNGRKVFRIELHVTAGQNTTINFSTAETSLSISALDVNRDGATDIVVEKAFTHQRLQVYLNNGHGEFWKSTESLPTPDGSGPLWRARIIVQNLPTPFLPSARGGNVAVDKPGLILHPQQKSTARFWTEPLEMQASARAPGAARAPPSVSL